MSADPSKTLHEIHAEGPPDQAAAYQFSFVLPVLARKHGFKIMGLPPGVDAIARFAVINPNGPGAMRFSLMAHTEAALTDHLGVVHRDGSALEVTWSEVAASWAEPFSDEWQQACVASVQERRDRILAVLATIPPQLAQVIGAGDCWPCEPTPQRENGLRVVNVLTPEGHILRVFLNRPDVPPRPPGEGVFWIDGDQEEAAMVLGLRLLEMRGERR